MWCNSTDPSGIGFASFVLIFLTGCMIVAITIIAPKGFWNAVLILCFLIMALWSHIKTMLSDPGSIPKNAMPLLIDIDFGQILCGRQV